MGKRGNTTQSKPRATKFTQAVLVQLLITPSFPSKHSWLNHSQSLPQNLFFISFFDSLLIRKILKGERGSIGLEKTMGKAGNSMAPEIQRARGDEGSRGSLRSMSTAPHLLSQPGHREGMTCLQGWLSRLQT